MSRRLPMLVLLVAGAYGCADEAMPDSAAAAAAGIETTRAGMEMAGDGMQRHDDGDAAGIGMMRDGMQMMSHGMSDMRAGFDEMESMSMMEGPMAGMMMNRACGGTTDAMAPMESAMGQMEDGMAMMTDHDDDNDDAGSAGFQTGHGAMAAAIDGVDHMMSCMGHGMSN